MAGQGYQILDFYMMFYIMLLYITRIANNGTLNLTNIMWLSRMNYQII